jgi:hypothetical protein
MAGTDRGEVRAAGTLERIAAVLADGQERTARQSSARSNVGRRLRESGNRRRGSERVEES